ncbi:MAG TPA: M60 family peptidase N-terminal accessory domain-containing protein, partial [Chthonomonadaceae bacterium]|nr:M60 family peptidase N-terminal accessory domain-containing protein [Chthonomonadaceae bacterium]
MRTHFLVGIAMVLGLLGMGLLPAWADKQDQDALLSGVKEIGAPGLPGTVCAFAPEAFPVVVGRVGRNLTEPVVAAGAYGKGHIVLFGHTAYLDDALETADTGKLVVNAVRWATPKKPTGPKPIWVRGLPRLLAYLQKQGLEARALDGDDWLTPLNEVGVLCMFTGDLNDREIRALQAYLERGGGLISADTGWGWKQIHGGKSLTEHPGNRLLAPAGLAWSEGMLQRTSPMGFDTLRAPSDLCQAQNALKTVVAQADGGAQHPADEIAQAVWTISAAARILPADDPLLRPRLKALQQAHQAELTQIGQKPLTAGDSLARLLLTLQLEETKNLPADKVQANPAAQSFPGGVPADARRISRAIDLDTSVPDWHSTGLYAAPGEKITVVIPQELIGKGLQVRIGAHTDTLWHLDRWERAPEITRTFPLKAQSTPAANAFGGPIYLVVPVKCKLGTVSVTLHNAVAAPYFVRGQTDLTAWRTAIRNAPAPWAELQANSVILTVP